ncbi:MAG: acyl-CoA dehydrogenase family protein [Actinomycetota bacterium]|nr:acyl-CoA dehydrogenase family protein [Actinomycetota bacterium]
MGKAYAHLIKRIVYYPSRHRAHHPPQQRARRCGKRGRNYNNWKCCQLLQGNRFAKFNTAEDDMRGDQSLGQDSPSDEKFRRMIRIFFDVTLRDALEGIEGELERARAWRRALFNAGLAGLDYPVEFGGQALDSGKIAIWFEESNGRIPSEEELFGIGVGMALPVIRDYGSDILKSRFLRPGLAGDEIWCQLYSEPGAGSDLASLATKAIRDGDEWGVTGQKVWTSGAQISQMAILLARTDPHVPKHRGITMFVLPMEQPGVAVRPLRQMTGAAEFNEVFLDEARIPSDWVIGDVNDGWRMAVALLAHERRQTGVASMRNLGRERLWGRVPIPVQQLIELARSKRRTDDPIVRQELSQLWINERIVGYLRGRGDTDPSIGKLWRTRQGQAAAEFAARMAFPASPAWAAADEDAVFFAFQVLNCRGMSLGGGSDEIQKNTIGERLLGLPREPAVDRNVPFSQLTSVRREGS